MIYDDYAKYCVEYAEKYGNDTVVLMEVGSFYELYAVRNSEETSGADIYEIASLMGIMVTRKNKKILENSRSNHLLAGFPSVQLTKFINILINADKTVVLVEQTTSPPNPNREVTKIYSPSTYDEFIFENDSTNYLMHVCLECTGQSLFVGISCVDCSTGMTFVEEVNSQVGDKSEVFEKIFKINADLCPKEVIVSSLTAVDKADIECVMRIFKSCKVYDKIHQLTHDISKNVFIENALARYHENESQLTIAEYLDLERMINGTISYAYLLEFLYNTNPRQRRTLNKPKRYFDDNNLVISYNATEQLNISCGAVSVLDLMNNCKTAIGRRYFRDRLLNPSRCQSTIEKSYKAIESYSCLDIDDIRKELSTIKDVQKIRNKEVRRFIPNDVYAIWQSVCALNDISERHGLECLGSTSLIDYISREFSLESDEFFNFGSRLCIDSASIFRDVSSFSELMNEINESKRCFHNFISDMPSEIPRDHFKVDHSDKEGYHIVCTPKRLKSYQANYKNLFVKCKVDIGKTIAKIFIDDGLQLNATIRGSESELLKQIDERFREAIENIKKNHLQDLNNLISVVEYIDFYTTCAYNNIKYRLRKPTLVSSCDSEPSYVKATNIRHPIIENISKKTRYIGNDIELNGDGMVLYGVNASGKSSLMKSIGISVILAQAGCYVPADRFEFKAFHKLFTRITGNDNIYKNQSTFVLEMSELRRILHQADSKTIVIGDELCSGTETVSAISIVAAGIRFLHKRGTSFIFATHLHELVNHIDTFAKIYHLSVSRDGHDIVYDRTLKPGSGDSLYGLEVCCSLDMDGEFLEMAHKIRNEYTSDSLLNVSRYNSGILKNSCEICGSGTNVDVHHIEEQQYADDNGYHNSFHKNDSHNLVPLCHKCHERVHKDEIKVCGYISTSRGIKLKYELSKEDQDDEKFRSDVCVLRRECSSDAELLDNLEKRYGKKIAKSKIKKILKENLFVLSNVTDSG